MKNRRGIFSRMLIALLPFMILKGSEPKTAKNNFYQYSKLSLRQAKEDSTKLSKEKRTNIYVTIDDGPSPASFYFNNIAMTDSVYLTMFVIGDSVFKNTSHRIFFNLYRLNPFIETGNHSFSHANGHYQQYYKNAQMVLADFIMNADSLHLNNKIARLPGRNTWRINGKARTDLTDADSAADGLRLQGYSTVGWDIEWKMNLDSSHSIEDAGEVINKIDRMARKKKFVYSKQHCTALPRKHVY